MRSLPTGAWVPGPVLGAGRSADVSFWGLSFTLVSPVFNTSRLRVCLDPEAARFGCPKDGPYRPQFGEVAAADSGFPEVPLGVLGNPPSKNNSPLRGFWGFPGVGIMRGWNMHAVCRGWVPAVR